MMRATYRALDGADKVLAWKSVALYARGDGALYQDETEVLVATAIGEVVVLHVHLPDLNVQMRLPLSFTVAMVGERIHVGAGGMAILRFDDPANHPPIPPVTVGSVSVMPDAGVLTARGAL